VKFKAADDGVREPALVSERRGDVASAIVTAIDIGDEVSVVCVFPAISATENELAAVNVEEVAPPPSTAVEIAAMVQTEEEL
jgi:hypothetical protein